MEREEGYRQVLGEKKNKKKKSLFNVLLLMPHLTPNMRWREAGGGCTQETVDDLLVASAECPSDDEDIDPCDSSVFIIFIIIIIKHNLYS
ncbi:hypothetical protein CCH79_00003177 [Gambusia affinis]|uniref:Uncharacterized protein n=1 Tax=Gambusia affinis TaxID=33528 RepID=A0A315VF12_GAMAF|nr:hypothetical protein CCH79_00003177 [Gambusia affinis]